MSRRLLVALVAVTAVIAGASGAFAAWSKSGSGSGASKASSLGTPTLSKPTCASSTPDSTHDRVSLSWTAVTGAASYDVLRATGAGSYSVVKNVSTTSTTDDIPMSPNGTTFNYKVHAKAGNWTGSDSGVHGETTNGGNGNCKTEF